VGRLLDHLAATLFDRPPPGWRRGVPDPATDHQPGRAGVEPGAKIRQEVEAAPLVADRDDQAGFGNGPGESDWCLGVGRRCSSSLPYVDGNKRVALVALVAFLDLSGIELKATNAEATTTILAVAAGEFTEDELTRWIEAHSVRSA
jgi:hypothetical protein